MAGTEQALRFPGRLLKEHEITPMLTQGKTSPPVQCGTGEEVLWSSFLPGNAGEVQPQEGCRAPLHWAWAILSLNRFLVLTSPSSWSLGAGITLQGSLLVSKKFGLDIPPQNDF